MTLSSQIVRHQLTIYQKQQIEMLKLVLFASVEPLENNGQYALSNVVGIMCPYIHPLDDVKPSL